MPDFREFQYHGPARAVRGGIRAQTKRGDFGKSWWGRRWLETLESFNLGGRLTRGKTYARNGQVIDLTVSEGKVTASVQGSRKAPYDVTMEMTTIAEATWHELAHSSFNQALIAAQLLSGTMPENVENLFKEKGLNLFPLREADLKTNCSCPDYSNPCKHIAAVYLLLGEEFDREPFLIFKLRGMSRVKLLRIIFSALERGNKLTKNLGTVGVSNTSKKGNDSNETKETGKESTSSKINQISEISQSSEHSEGIEKIPAAKPEFLPTNPSLFWIDALEKPAPLPPARMPSTTAQLVKTIGSPPFWRANENFLDAMDRVYQNASKYATRFLIDEHDKEDNATED